MQIKSISIPRPGFVYMIGSERYGWYKIGFSKNCEIRIDQLGILLPFKVELFAVWKSFDGLSLETEMHAKYRHFHIHGEWFSMNDNDRITVIEDDKPIRCELIFPVGFVHKRAISSSAIKDHTLQKCDTKWKSERNKEQQKRIRNWLNERGLDPNNIDHIRMAWAVEVSAKKLQKEAPLEVL